MVMHSKEAASHAEFRRGIRRMSLLAATQIMAVTTAILALFAFVTAVLRIPGAPQAVREAGLFQRQAARQ